MAMAITRRQFAAAGMALPTLLASRSLGAGNDAGKADITVGITVDTRPDWSGPANFIRSIDEASAAGYHWIETFWQYVARWADNPQGLKDELSQRNLRLETVSNGGGGSAGQDILADFVDPRKRAAVIADHMKLVGFIKWFGCDHLKINVHGTHAPGDRTKDYTEMATTFNEVGKRMTDMGMKFGVHAHVGSAFETREDVDAIMERTNPKDVYFVLDTGQVTMAGMDPVQLTRTYISRIIEFHLKDVAPENRGGYKAPPRQQVGEGRSRGPQQPKQPGVNPYAGRRQFFELGHGGVDFPGILAILNEHSWKGWMTVELDSTETTAKESCAVSKKYIETVLKLKV